MSNLYKGPSVDASYQVSVHLVQGCFLQNFGSFGRGVSEEKIKMRKVNGRQVKAKAHIAFVKAS